MKRNREFIMLDITYIKKLILLLVTLFISYPAVYKLGKYFGTIIAQIYFFNNKNL